MERKIGEIFEYEGEWYQCVKSTDGSCRDCDMNFGCKCPIPIKECTESGRSDKTYVIFKKLEKVGEPFSCNYHGDRKLIMMQEYKAYNTNIVSANNIPMYVSNYKHKRIAIELKQNQENMEEKKDTELSNLENTGKNLKPFDLEAAKSGRPVCTRDGRKVRIALFDLKDKNYPIAAAVQDGNGDESIRTYTSEGIYDKGEISGLDLMMLPEKHEGWINICKNADEEYYTKGVFNSEKYARYNEVNYPGSIVATVKIEWEE